MLLHTEPTHLLDAHHARIAEAEAYHRLRPRRASRPAANRWLARIRRPVRRPLIVDTAVLVPAGQ